MEVVLVFKASVQLFAQNLMIAFNHQLSAVCKDIAK